MKQVYKTILPALSLLVAGQIQAFERTALLPPAEVYVRITNVENLLNEFNAAYGDRLRADPKVQGFTEAFSEKIEKKIANNDLSIITRQQVETFKLLHGEIAMVNHGQTKSSLLGERIYLAAGASGEDYTKILERTEWLHGELKDDVVRRKDTFQQADLINDIMYAGQTNEASYWMSHSGSTFLLSTDKEWVEKSLVRLRNETVREPKENKLVIHFPIEEWMADALENNTENQIQKRALWNSLGFLNIEKYVLEIEMKEGDLILDGTLSVSDLTSGLFSLLDTSPEDFSGDRLIPPDATSFSYGKIDLPGFWKRLPEILGTMPPKQSAAFMGVLGVFQQRSQLDIQHDLMAHLGRNFTLHTEQSTTNQPLLVSLELTDDDAMEASFTKLLASPFAQSWAHLLRTVDFRGQTLYQMKPKTPDAEPSSICFMDDRLIFSTSAVLMRNAIMRLGSEIDSEPSAMQKTAQATAPDTSFGYGAMDHRKAHSLIYINVSDSSFSAGMTIGTKEQKKAEELGENEISLSHLTSFLGNTYHYAEAVPGGIHHRLVFETDKTHGAP